MSKRHEVTDALAEVLIAADRVDSRSSLAGDTPADGYWVSLREMTVLRTALAHPKIQKVLDAAAPALMRKGG